MKTQERKDELANLTIKVYSQIKDELGDLACKMSGQEFLFSTAIILHCLLKEILGNLSQVFNSIPKETAAPEFLLDYENIKTAEECMAAIISNHQSEETF